MQRGRDYLVGLREAPSIEPKIGSWALIRYQPGGSTQVTPIVSTVSRWAKSVHVRALANGLDPVLGRDEFCYRDANDIGEARTIESFTPL